MFTVEEREKVRGRVLEVADGDERIVAGAVVGSAAAGRVDRWSDIDLTFAVREGVTVAEVLEDWTAVMRREFDAEFLLDLAVATSIYRVFLLPGALQVDLSFTPAADFGPRGPEFRLLFGDAARHPSPVVAPDPGHLFGLAVLKLLHARTCIRRQRNWQAEYWISGARDDALTIACLARNLPTREGRGYDRLPAGILERFQPAIVRSLDHDELLRALGAAVDALLAESNDERTNRLTPLLRSLGA